MYSTTDLLAALIELRTALVSPAPVGGWNEPGDSETAWPYVELELSLDELWPGVCTLTETIFADTVSEARAVADRLIAALHEKSYRGGSGVDIVAHLFESGPRLRPSAGRVEMEITWTVQLLWRTA